MNNAIIGFYEEPTKSGMYQHIDHKYLERGHTYLENDREFAQIEKRKSTAEVFAPDDWVHVINETNLRKPFVATKMRQEDFHEPIPLNSGKVKDVEKLVKFVPEPQRQFYVNIVSNPTIENSIAKEDSD